MRRSHLTGLLLAIVALAALAGCSFTAELDDGPIEALRCTTSSDCAAGHLCTEDGFCAYFGFDATPGADSGDVADDTPDNAPECEAGEDRCGEACVDTQSDAQHCGGCDVVCEGGEVCREGQCTTPLSCEPAQTACGAVCVDLDTDAAHCGQCDRVCGQGAGCRREGQCVCGFGPGSQSDCHLDLPNVASARCTGGSGRTCTIECAAGFEDRDGDYRNGCETAR